jgi:hypothetical protein
MLVVWLSLVSLLWAEPAKPTKAVANPPLLGLRWDFSDGSHSAWRHKDNARLAIAEDGANQALRLESGFTPFDFTWTTVNIPPHSAAGTVHVRFRLRGDRSGQEVVATVGAAGTEDHPRPRYYLNSKQSIRLDFAGWRTFTLDLDQFETPSNTLRSRDLASVVFFQFMVTRRGSRPTVDLWIDDIEFLGPTEAERAEVERQKTVCTKILAETEKRLAQVQTQFDTLRRDLDQQAKQGKYVDVARLYLAALEWCAADIRRSLEAEEFATVERAPKAMDDLARRLADPRAVLGRVLDRRPEQRDTLDIPHNPYVQSILGVVRHQTKLQRATPKGRKGFESISNAWSFAGLGNTFFENVWMITRPQSPLRHDPTVLANALGVLDTIAQQHTDGDFNVGRVAIHGRDTNINRFCLAPTLNGWLLLREAYPDLLPPGKTAELEAGLKQLADFQLTDYGLARLAREPHEEFPAYPNMDVHYLLIMEFARRLWGEEPYARERDAFVKLVQTALYPRGAFAYINTQNECFVYHQINVVFLARYWQLTGDKGVLDSLRRTIPYYPYNVEPAGMPEYYTDACWKHYWSGGSVAGPDMIAGLFDDPLNKQVAQTCGAIAGYGHGHIAAIAAESWKPVAAKPLPDQYTLFDDDVQGPRGRYGVWSFAGNGRNYGVGYQGKDTFVGAMITDPERRPLPLDSALQVVTTEVRLNHTDNHWIGARCTSALERLTTTLGPDFGSLAVRYTVSKPNWHHKNDDLFPWDGMQAWYLSKSRLVGLVALEATADETRAAVHGRIRLGMSRELAPCGENGWRYGRMVVTVHDHNYAKIATRPSETFFLDKPENYKSTEITLLDPLSVKAGEKGEIKYAKGTRYWFLVEIRPDGVPPAESVRRVEESPVVGFAFREPGRQVVLLHNPSDVAAEGQLPAAQAGATRLVYEENTGKGRRAEATATRVRLGPQRHSLIVDETRP